MMDVKIKRRLKLLDDAIDALLRSRCMFGMCNGPRAPIVEMKTCARCYVLHRAIQMKLLVPAPEPYVRKETGIGGCQSFVDKGVLEQFSSVDNSKLI